MPVVKVRHCANAKSEIELCFETFGDKTREPLLLIQGLGTQMLAYDVQFCQLLVEAGFFVIRFDNRDVGLSTHLDHLGTPPLVWNYMKTYMWMQPPSPYTLSDMAADAVALLDQLEIRAAHIAGSSMGGMIAQIIALEYPDRVRSLTSIMSTTSDARQATPSWRMRLRLITPLPADPDAAFRARMDMLQALSAPEHWDPEATAKYLRSAIERSTYRAGMPRQTAAIIATPPRGERLKQLRCPALVIHGRQDPLCPVENGFKTASAIDNCDLLILDDMGHTLPAPLWPRIADAIRTVASKATVS
eukprot:TRINITY_DN12459_c0_g1_i1.p1 TRINITY_DN12459_c0_g1~~TRINITY_DN12459_c0_g1_i1.p1  ORF type:complete len:303 (-),score=41.21 TRINITY_DN12459_c0_g1_i1:36-944(-)